MASGDYKRQPDPTCAPFEPIKCDVFITEATFGLPVFRHPPDHEEMARLLKSVAQFPERSHLIGAYALGKAQRVIRLLRDYGYQDTIYIHGALARLSEYYESQGVSLGPLEPATVENTGKNTFAGSHRCRSAISLRRPVGATVSRSGGMLRIRLDAHKTARKAAGCRTAVDHL